MMGFFLTRFAIPVGGVLAAGTAVVSSDSFTQILVAVISTVGVIGAALFASHQVRRNETREWASPLEVERLQREIETLRTQYDKDVGRLQRELDMCKAQLSEARDLNGRLMSRILGYGDGYSDDDT